jgi:hypothetical protein
VLPIHQARELAGALLSCAKAQQLNTFVACCGLRILLASQNLHDLHWFTWCANLYIYTYIKYINQQNTFNSTSLKVVYSIRLHDISTISIYFPYFIIFPLGRWDARSSCSISERINKGHPWETEGLSLWDSQLSSTTCPKSSKTGAAHLLLSAVGTSSGHRGKQTLVTGRGIHLWIATCLPNTLWECQRPFLCGLVRFKLIEASNYKYIYNDFQTG